MSEYIFKLPDLGEGLVEAEIAEWMVKVGDMVQEEDPIGSVLTDKAAVELSAPVSGRVLSLAGDLGDIVAVGSALITFETSGEQAAPAAKTAEAAEVSPVVVKQTTPEAAPAPIMVCTSSINKMALSRFLSSAKRPLNRFSKSPRYLVPASSDPRSNE